MSLIRGGVGGGNWRRLWKVLGARRRGVGRALGTVDVFTSWV